MLAYSTATRRLSWVALVLGVIAQACSSSSDSADDGGSTCSTAPACPTAGAPSYESVVVPILQSSCIPCHGTNDQGGFDSSSYTQVFNERSAILDQVSGCMMPPLNGGQLTATQRIALTGWLECGAPNN